MFASMMGFILSFVLLFLFIIVGVATSSSKKVVKLEENTILHLTLDQPILDRTNENPFAGFAGGSFGEQAPGLNDILHNIQKAAKNENIIGIFLDISVIPSGIASIEEIRNELTEFKKSG